jgi:hypothetical protein
MKHVFYLRYSGSSRKTSKCIPQIILFVVALSLYISTEIDIRAEYINLISWNILFKNELHESTYSDSM